MANADISLLFGVLGEGSLSGESGSLIQTQLTQIMAALNKNPLKVKIALDTESGGQKSWSSQLQSKLNTVSSSGKFSVQVSKLTLGAGAITDFRNQLNAVVNTLHLDKGTTITLTAEGIGEIKSKMKQAGDAASDAARKTAEFKVQMEALNKQKVAVQRALSSLSASATTDEERAKVAELTTQYEQWAVKIEEIRATKTAVNGTYRAEIEAEGAAITANITKLNEERAAAESAAKANTEAANLRSEAAKDSENAIKKESDSLKRAAQEATTYNNLYKQINSTIMQVRDAQKNWTAAETGRTRGEYAALDDYVRRLEELRGVYKTLTPAQVRQSLSEITSEFKNSSEAIRAAGENTRTFGQRIGSLAQKFGTWFSITRVMMAAVRSVRQMIKATIELDDAMTQLRIVTRDTSQAYVEYLDKISKTATKIGSTIPDLIDSTTTFARLGYSLDESSALAEFTAMLQNVGDIDVADAQDALTAIVKAFGISVDEIESVMDKLVITGNNFPISVAQIAEGMNNASSALAAAGNTFDQSVALLTAANTTIQNAAKSSTGLRTIAARLRSTKTELDELGESMTEAEYGELVAALTKYNVALTDINGEFRSTYDIVADIASVWDELSSMEQAALANAIAGVRQQSVFYSMVEQFREASGAMEKMANSAGTLQESYATYMESTTAHINQFKAAFQSLSQSTFTTEFLNNFVDLGTSMLGILEAITRIINVVGGLNTVLFVTAGIIATIKADALLAILLKLVAPIKAIITSIQAAQDAGVTAGRFISNAFNQIAASASTAQIAVGAFFAVFAVVSIIKNSIEGARQKAIELAEATIQETNAELERIDTLKESYAIYKKYANQENLTTAQENALQGAIERITEAMEGKNTALANLTAGTEKYTEALDGQIAKELEAQSIAAKERRHAAKEKLEELSWSGWDGSQITIKVSDTAKDDTDSYKLVQEIMGDFIDEGLYHGSHGVGATDIEIEPINWDSNQDVDAIVDYYYKLIELKDALVKAGLMDTDDVYDIYGSVKDVIGDIGPAVEEYVKAEYDTIYAAYEGMNGVVDTAEEFTGLREYLNEQLGKKFSFDGLPDTIDGFLAGENGMFGDFLNSATGAVSEVKDAVGVYKASLSELSETVTNLQSAYTLLNTAKEEMASGGGLSAGTIKSLAEASENYLDYLYEENGVVKLNTEAWKENANAKMQGEMADIQREIYSLEEQNAALAANREALEARNRELEDSVNANGVFDISVPGVNEEYYEWDANNQKIAENTRQIERNAAVIAEHQAKLSLYSSLYDSIAGQIKSTLNAFDGYTTGMEGLANLQELVANGFTVAADKVRELASAYPEILEAAVATANGEIQLNEDVVNSVIQSKRVELNGAIDAEIGKLEAKRALLQAELDIINEQVSAAESADDATVTSANEAAGAKMAIEQAVLSACEQAGIDEQTANQLALAAMTGDWDTFSSLAQDAMYDLDDESATAFTSVMNNFATMSQNIVNNTNEIIGAYSKMGEALSRAMQGLTTNKYSASISGGSVSGGGKDAVEGLLSDMFESAKSDYGSGGTTLDNQMDVWKQRLQDIADSYTNSGSNLNELLARQSSLNKQIASVNGQIQLLESLKNKPIDSFKSSASGSSGSGSGTSSVKEVEEYIATIDDYREAIERLNRIRIKKSELELELSNTDDLKEQIRLQQSLVNIYRDEQDALHNLNDLRDKTIADGADTLRQLGFDVEYDADYNKFFIKNLEHLNELVADNKGEYDSLQEATNALREETEALIETLEDLNEENQEGSKTWMELRNSIREAKIAIIDALKDIVSEASDAVDEIQNVYDTLKDAADEYAENGGFISVDAFQKIIELGPQYMQYLRDENGLLVINEENINKVIEARVRQLGVEQAMTYVERLRQALLPGSIENLDTLLYATTDLTDATFGLAKAELLLMRQRGDLDDQQYAAALHNIEAIEDLTNITIAGIGQTAGGAKEKLDEMKSGIDDILKYVMDMLKHRIQQQIDALEDLKDAYGDIISLRKESLDAAKQEAEYEDKVAEKVKQIAKLQEKINALSLDDSRDAQAQKIKLEEELAELQKELADDQNDYAVDAQKDALDDMQKAYEDEKDAEIRALEETISSYQKLYDMAIDYIENHWNTLYDELIAWNTEYGSVLNSEITTAWENCLAAAQRYGSYVAALNNIDNDIAASTGNGPTGTNNTIVGTTGNNTASSKEDSIHAIIKEMYSNSQEHHTASKERKAWLDNRNLQLGTMLAQYGVNTHRDNGTWYMDGSSQLLYDKYKKYIYHKGGIAGDNPTLKQNEIMAILEKGEAVLDKKKEQGLYRLVEFATTLADKFGDLIKSADLSHAFAGAGNGLTDAKADIPSSVMNSKSVNIEFGPTYIYGANDETVEKHRAITRQQANELFEKLNIKR